MCVGEELAQVYVRDIVDTVFCIRSEKDWVRVIFDGLHWNRIGDGISKEIKDLATNNDKGVIDFIFFLIICWWYVVGRRLFLVWYFIFENIFKKINAVNIIIYSIGRDLKLIDGRYIELITDYISGCWTRSFYVSNFLSIAFQILPSTKTWSTSYLIISLVPLQVIK